MSKESMDVMFKLRDAALTYSSRPNDDNLCQLLTVACDYAAVAKPVPQDLALAILHKNLADIQVNHLYHNYVLPAEAKVDAVRQVLKDWDPLDAVNNPLYEQVERAIDHGQ